jgi:hypothetical protein
MLHDETAAHCAIRVHQLCQRGVTDLEQSPYSLDLAPESGQKPPNSDLSLGPKNGQKPKVKFEFGTPTIGKSPEIEFYFGP